MTRGRRHETFVGCGPALLTWQILALALVFGLLALRYFWPACVGLVLLALAWGPHWRRAVALVACFALGWLWAFCVMPELPTQTPQWMLQRQKAQVRGQVVQVQSAPGQMLRVFLNDTRYELDDGTCGTLPGVFLWNWLEPSKRPVPGQEVQVRLRVRPVRGFANEGLWDSRFYWGLREVYYRGFSRGYRGSPLLGAVEPGWSERLRERLREVVDQACGDSAGTGVLGALILGERFHLQYETYDLLRRASLAHSMALSGLHLGFAAALGFVLAWGVGVCWPGVFLHVPRLKLGVLLAAPLVLGYAWLGGMTPSLVRSAIMFAAWGLWLWRDRGRVLLDGLFVALAAIVLVSPLSVFDVRLQLSATAVAGIALLCPLVRRVVVPRGKAQATLVPRAVRGLGWSAGGILLASFCATLAVLPLAVWSFGELALGLYVNVLWLPFLGFVVIPMGLVGLVAAMLPGLHTVGAVLLRWDAGVVSVGLDVLSWLDGQGLLPVILPPRPLWPHLVGYYSLLGCAVLWWARARRRACLLGGLGVLLCVWPLITAVDRGVTLDVLDVGQSQAVLVTTAQGRRVLVDGSGGWKGGIDPGRVVVAPFLARGQWPDLDLVILTHPDSDHYLGLVYLCQRVSIGAFAHSGRWPTGAEGEALREGLAAHEVPVQVLRAGQRLGIGQDLVLEVLHPEAETGQESNNDLSVVLRLVWQGRGLALLPGDVEAEGLAALLGRGAELRAQALVLPHHGSANSLSHELYDRVRPQVALAATGFINYLKFPSPAIRAQMQERGIVLLDTGTFGGVRVRWRSPDSPAAVSSVLGGELP